MDKVVTILGARPQFIKAAAVSKALASEGIEEIIIHTGQHFDANMSKIFFEEMEIPDPAYNLGIHSLTHGAMTGKMMVEIEKILSELQPDAVIIYGDTNSTLAGALAAKKLNIQVAHIEAGLRSYNREMPEEINRIAADSISDFLFCPTSTAVENAEAESLHHRASVVLTGDVMYDAMIQFKSKAKHPDGIPERDYILCTIHRQENTDDAEVFENLMDALNTLATNHKIIFPAHPRVKKLLDKHKIHSNIIILSPVGYLEMLSLIKNSSLVLTDSGGLQKEAFFARKYCITLRKETEWVELVENGYNKVVGDNKEWILSAVEEWFGREIISPQPLYGIGNASEIIVSQLKNHGLSPNSNSSGLPDRDFRKNLGCG